MRSCSANQQPHILIPTLLHQGINPQDRVTEPEKAKQRLKEMNCGKLENQYSQRQRTGMSKRECEKSYFNWRRELTSDSGKDY
jgi:hypothetical protein